MAFSFLHMIPAKTLNYNKTSKWSTLRAQTWTSAAQFSKIVHSMWRALYLQCLWRMLSCDAVMWKLANPSRILIIILQNLKKIIHRDNHISFKGFFSSNQQMAIRLTSAPVPMPTSTSLPVLWSCTCETFPFLSSRLTCTPNLFKLQVRTPSLWVIPLQHCVSGSALILILPLTQRRNAKCWIPTGGRPREFAAASPGPLRDPPLPDGSPQEVRFYTLYLSFIETYAAFFSVLKKFEWSQVDSYYLLLINL